MIVKAILECIVIGVSKPSTGDGGGRRFMRSKCHEALDGKSEGKSEKLSTTQATPFMIPAGKNLYFVTDSSISVLENKFAGNPLNYKRAS